MKRLGPERRPRLLASSTGGSVWWVDTGTLDVCVVKILVKVAAPDEVQGRWGARPAACRVVSDGWWQLPGSARQLLDRALVSVTADEEGLIITCAAAPADAQVMIPLLVSELDQGAPTCLTSLGHLIVGNGGWRRGPLREAGFRSLLFPRNDRASMPTDVPLRGPRVSLGELAVEIGLPELVAARGLDIVVVGSRAVAERLADLCPTQRRRTPSAPVPYRLGREAGPEPWDPRLFSGLHGVLTCGTVVPARRDNPRWHALVALGQACNHHFSFSLVQGAGLRGNRSYDAAFRCESHAGYALAMATADCAGGDAQHVADAVRGHLRSVDRWLTREALRRVQSQILHESQWRYSTLDMIAYAAASRVLLSEPVDWLDRTLEAIAALRREEVVEAAEDLMALPWVASFCSTRVEGGGRL